jgi:hypothetical protein
VACGFAGSVWAPHTRRDNANLLLLLHGLGDSPAAFARFAAQLALPMTSALALAAPLPLPVGLPGGMWHESFEPDGALIDGTRRGERRRISSLASATRVRLEALLSLLESGSGWPRVCAAAQDPTLGVPSPRAFITCLSPRAVTACLRRVPTRTPFAARRATPRSASSSLGMARAGPPPSTRSPTWESVAGWAAW